MYGTPWTTEDLETLKRMHEEEEACCSQIAERLGVKKARVHQKCMELGIYLRHEHEWSSKELAKLRELAAQDKNSDEIAEELPGRTSCAVAAKARTLGIFVYVPKEPDAPRRPSAKEWTMSEERRLKELIYSTLSIKETAKALGRSPNAIRVKMSMSGISLRAAKKEFAQRGIK